MNNTFNLDATAGVVFVVVVGIGCCGCCGGCGGIENEGVHDDAEAFKVVFLGGAIGAWDSIFNAGNLDNYTKI